MAQIDPHAERLTAIVPARNEEAVIAECLRSLAQQTEIAEIIVVNDQSSDHTAEIVRGLMGEIANLRLLEAEDLPSGWAGKNHAVWQGARASSGDWLLFTDADAVHEADAARKALGIARVYGAALVSFSPEQVLLNWYEKALLPYVFVRLAHFFSYDDVNDGAKTAAAANGQFLLIRRDAYEAVGGHASVAADLLEDVALARRVKERGYKIWFGSGQGIVRVRMYRSFSAMWEGWKKNLYRLVGGTSDAVLKEITRAVAPIFLALLVSGLFWLLSGSSQRAVAIFCGIVFGMMVGFAMELRRGGFPARFAGYALPGRFLYAAVLWASYRSHVRGRLEWKGRAYPAGTPGASNE